jgi:hypothetical protein
MSGLGRKLELKVDLSLRDLRLHNRKESGLGTASPHHLERGLAQGVWCGEEMGRWVVGWVCGAKN